MIEPIRALIAVLNESVSRRSALKILGLGAAALGSPGCSQVSKKTEKIIGSPTLTTSEGTSFSPIDRLSAGTPQADFSGDHPEKIHRLLRSPPAVPQQAHEKTSVVIVGGGISGLMTAYLLRKYNPILLEQADRLGGNSKGESWNGSDYPIGATYIAEAAAGTTLHSFYQEIGLTEDKYRLTSIADPVIYNGKLINDFWNGATAPAHQEEFVRLKKYFLDVLKSKNGKMYPEIPITDKSQEHYVRLLDRLTLKDHLTQINGKALHPHIYTRIEHYCWSAMGGSSSEISAAAGLNFYVTEFDRRCVLPGGNSGIAELLLKKLIKTVSKENFRTQSPVFRVTAEADSSRVSYIAPNGTVRSIQAKAVVMACPKFVAAKIIQDLDEKRVQAINRLKYRPYVVGNLLINGRVDDRYHDIYLLNGARESEISVQEASETQRITDVFYGTYADSGSDRTVLTLSQAVPYDGTRSALYASGSYQKYRKSFEEQVQSQILPAMGISPKQVVDLRLSRWGHSIPVAQAGMIADGTIQRLRAPFRRRVFFVEQDNWMLPAFETGVNEALNWSKQVEKVVEA